jgi:hypothetical protein
LFLGPSSALRQSANILICTAYRALNTDQHPVQFGTFYFFHGPNLSQSTVSRSWKRGQQLEKENQFDLIKGNA